MAEFVRAQIFGTTFEITSRYGTLPPHRSALRRLTCDIDMPIYNLLEWEPLALYGEYSMLNLCLEVSTNDRLSARRRINLPAKPSR